MCGLERTQRLVTTTQEKQASRGQVCKGKCEKTWHRCVCLPVLLHSRIVRLDEARTPGLGPVDLRSSPLEMEAVGDHQLHPGPRAGADHGARVGLPDRHGL